MPQVTVYIREDDLELWKAVTKKSALIHWALENYQKKTKASTTISYTPPEEVA